jgi:hypothetical protein
MKNYHGFTSGRGERGAYFRGYSWILLGGCGCALRILGKPMQKYRCSCWLWGASPGFSKCVEETFTYGFLEIVKVIAPICLCTLLGKYGFAWFSLGVPAARFPDKPKDTCSC